MQLITTPLLKSSLNVIARELFGDFVKAVVDIEEKVIVIGGELHADEEQVLIESGSKQENLWGINLYPSETGDDFVEFNSMINIRPSQNNRSRGVEDVETQKRIREIVTSLITE